MEQVFTVQWGSPSSMYSSTRALTISMYLSSPVTREASHMPKYATPQGQSQGMSMFMVCSATASMALSTRCLS